jgi:hypothetical protein
VWSPKKSGADGTWELGFSAPAFPVWFLATPKSSNISAKRIFLFFFFPTFPEPCSILEREREREIVIRFRETSPKEKIGNPIWLASWRGRNRGRMAVAGGRRRIHFASRSRPTILPRHTLSCLSNRRMVFSKIGQD